MRRQSRFVIAGALLLAAIGVLVAFGVRSTGLRHFTPDQLAAQAGPIQGGIQLDGVVVPGSTVKLTDLKFAFQMTDPEGRAKIDVVYTGIKPDTFKEGEGVVVEGTYDHQTRKVLATKLMTKCPSKYEAKADEETSKS